VCVWMRGRVRGVEVSDGRIFRGEIAWIVRLALLYRSYLAHLRKLWRRKSGLERKYGLRLQRGVVVVEVGIIRSC
jgi:hypothetical protein